jgi:SAM-dependent methyltransferase
MSDPSEYGTEYTAYQADRSRARKLARTPWLRATARFVQGPAVDLGCGVGELLARLPHGSIGLEINRTTIDHCVAHGLDVSYYDGSVDGWGLAPVRERDTRFDTLVLSHVLEHLDDPAAVLHALLVSAGEIGMRQVLVVVPGRAGYASDDTHRTFVDRDYLARPDIVDGTSFRAGPTSFFPGNVRAVGDRFTYHELRAPFLRA